MKKENALEGQYRMEDYEFKEVNVRLKLSDGPSYYSTTPIQSPADAVRILRDVLREMDRENVLVALLDSHLKPISFSCISVGSVDTAIVPIQNCMKAAILTNASSLMLFHNHPSGEIEPSEEDRQVTKQLSFASKLMGFQLLDHVIVGGVNGHIRSLRQDEPWLFAEQDLDVDYMKSMLRELNGQVEDGKAMYSPLVSEYKEMASAYKESHAGQTNPIVEKMTEKKEKDQRIGEVKKPEREEKHRQDKTQQEEVR